MSATRREPTKVKLNEVSPELAIDLMRSCLLSGIERFREVKIDKICFKIICFGKLLIP